MENRFKGVNNTGILPMIAIFIVILIAIVGLYAMLYGSKYEDDFDVGNFRCGKIAVAVDGRGINSNISEQFARAEYYLIIEPFSGKYKSIKNPYINFDNSAGVRAAQLISGETEEAVITKNIGPNAYGLLDGLGIKVYTVNSGTAQDAVKKFKEAKLTETANATVLQYYGKKAVLANGGSNYYTCPNCYTRVPCTQNNNGRMCCPSCGGIMNQIAGGLFPNTGIGGTDLSVAGGIGLGLGPVGNLVCPDCGMVIQHQRGVPCYTVNCPQCGATMVRQFPANIQTAFTATDNNQNNQTTITPPITTDAVMKHAYRGVCSKCHAIVDKAADSNIIGAAYRIGPGGCIIR
ncbi:NifB/NifX family molybdenum-iron cluster-binding protein [candidate division KSB1 bacterium]